MVARGKVITAKWGVPAGEPDDLPDFMSNEEIVEKMGGEPKGVFRVLIKKMIVVKNSNDNDMIKVTAEINETDKAKKGYNGFVFWENQNITEKSAPFLKQFLKSFGVSWEDFQKRTKLTPETATEPAQVISMGSVKIDSGKVFARITTKWQGEQNGYQAKTVVGRWLPQADDVEDELAEADDEELDDEELDGEEEELEEGEDEESEDEADEEEAELREELEGLSLLALKKRVKANAEEAEETVPKMAGLKKPELIDLVVGQEILLDDEEELEDEDEEEGDDEAESELREELAGMTLSALKQRAKKNGEKVAILRPIKGTEEVIEIIVAQELGDGEDEDGEEPPF